MAVTPDGGGYWLVASDGGIFTFGDAAFFGSTGAMHLNKPIVGMAATPDGRGYWLVASDGGHLHLRRRQVLRLDGRQALEPADRRHGGHATRATATGWWPPTAGSSPSDDASSSAPPGALPLNKPIVGMAGHPDRQRLLAGGLRRRDLRLRRRSVLRLDRRYALNKPIVGMALTPTGNGYWLVASDGGIFSFGDATFYGSTGAMTLNQPIVGMGAQPG